MEENNEFERLLLWLSDGGQPTMQAFQKLLPDERKDSLECVQKFSFNEELKLDNGKRYLLSHSGSREICGDRPLEEIPVDALISDCIWVTGHTPTRRISGAEPDRIYRNNHISMDYGGVFGGYLSALRLENGKEFYEENLDR